MTVADFNFDEFSPEFDAHIGASIPGYSQLGRLMAAFSRSFVQPDTRVVDLGCSTGATLSAIWAANQPSRGGVDFVGVDLATGFQQHWRHRQREGLRFEIADALTFEGAKNLSLAISSFTLQFIPERHRLSFLQRIHAGLVDGGALFIAEKTLAGSASLQELITFGYYDHKLSTFSAAEVLDKERRLRGVMKPWTRSRLIGALYAAGFHADDVESFWQEGPFVAFVAVKRSTFSRSRTVRSRLIAA